MWCVLCSFADVAHVFRAMVLRAASTRCSDGEKGVYEQYYEYRKRKVGGEVHTEEEEVVVSPPPVIRPSWAILLEAIDSEI